MHDTVPTTNPTRDVPAIFDRVANLIAAHGDAELLAAVTAMYDSDRLTAADKATALAGLAEAISLNRVLQAAGPEAAGPVLAELRTAVDAYSRGGAA